MRFPLLKSGRSGPASIKHEERKKGQREHASETKEKHAELRVLVIVGRVCQTCCVEEPQRRIDADSVAPLAIYILLETVDMTTARWAKERCFRLCGGSTDDQGKKR